GVQFVGIANPGCARSTRDPGLPCRTPARRGSTRLSVADPGCARFARDPSLCCLTPSAYCRTRQRVRRVRQVYSRGRTANSRRPSVRRPGAPGLTPPTALRRHAAAPLRGAFVLSLSHRVSTDEP